ncbi:TetR/AcrR family transcriptional regulator [Nocardiopsis changdeensis]|uniref:TetR/AcrR family transcriptional regulator n=1 Tax=Nocardiopsis changdeensis TaxID=2831969 RepID=A0ABX8BNR2_9ACTN|nr:MULTISPECIES: TetR/AcrR family transcriptional regulator [Nocardiopsis]QUX23724.1 TetR/AcrR family transcriptional regulator [Nocardiopsis changdeensis]QYX39668.1 TetR/AcrR family transcriptional regulator [Nocardiopsis sp. MT53]
MSQREDLLAGARRCLVEKGYAKTTARDIAAASGAHLASIGYHFGSKDALMNAAVLEASGEWGDVFTRAVRASRAEAPEDRMRVLLTSLLETLPEQRDLLVSSVQAFGQAQFDESMRAALAAGIDEGRRELAALVLDLPADGIDPAVVAGVGSVLYNLVAGYVLQYLVAPDSLPTAEQALAGLRALTAPS